MKKILCKLTGGHRYSDENIRTYEDKVFREILVKNWCCKCGEERTYRIPFDRLFTQSELEIMGLVESGKENT